MRPDRGLATGVFGIGRRPDDRFLAGDQPRAVGTQRERAYMKIVAELRGVAPLIRLLRIGRDRLRPVEEPHLVAVEVDGQQSGQPTDQDLPQRLVHLDLEEGVLGPLEIRQPIAPVKPGPFRRIEPLHDGAIPPIQQKAITPARCGGDDAVAAVDPAGEIGVMLRQELFPEQRALLRKAEQVVAVAHGADEHPSAGGIDVDGPNPVFAGERVAERGRRRWPGCGRHEIGAAGESGLGQGPRPGPLPLARRGDGRQRRDARTQTGVVVGEDADGVERVREAVAGPVDHRPAGRREILGNHLREHVAAGERLEQTVFVPLAQQDQGRVDEQARIDQFPAPQPAAIENGNRAPVVDDASHLRNRGDPRRPALGLQGGDEPLRVRTHPRLLGIDRDHDVRRLSRGLFRDEPADAFRLVDPHLSAVEPARHGRLLGRSDLHRSLRHRPADQFTDAQRPGSRRGIDGHPPSRLVKRLGRAEDVELLVAFRIRDRDLDREGRLDGLAVGTGHAHPEAQVRTGDQPGVGCQRDLFDRRGQERVDLARQVPQVSRERHPVAVLLHRHRLHLEHVVDVARAGGEAERRDIGSLKKRQVRPGEPGRREVRHDEVFTLSASEPIRADDPVVDRRRRDPLGERLAHDLRHLFRAVPDVAGLEIDVPRKRAPQLVVEVVEIGMQPHDAVDRQLARPLHEHRLSGGDQLPQCLENRRRGLVLVVITRREDDVVRRSLAREELVVVEEVGGKTGSRAGDPDTFRRAVEIVRLAALQEGRLPGIEHRHPAVSTLQAEQEIPVRRRHGGDVARGVAHVVRRGLGRIAVDLEIAQALNALRDAEDRLPHHRRAVDAAGVAKNLRPDRDVVPHLQDVGHDRCEHRTIPLAAVLVHHGRGHIERVEHVGRRAVAGEVAAVGSLGTVERPCPHVGGDLLDGGIHAPREQGPVAVAVREPRAELREILEPPLPGWPAREAVQSLHGVGTRHVGMPLAIPHLLRLEKRRHHGTGGVVVARLVELVVEADALERGAECHRGRFQADEAIAGVEDHRIPRQHAVVVGEDVFVELQVAADGGVEEAVASAGLVVALPRAQFRPLPHQLLELLPVPVDAGHGVIHA